MNSANTPTPKSDHTLRLPTILADELLPDWLIEFEQVIILHMIELLQHVPTAHEVEFETEIRWLKQFVEQRFQPHSTETLQTLSQAYRLVANQKQLKDRPLPGFICYEINTVGSQRIVFLQYKSLVLLSAIRLFLLTKISNLESFIEKGQQLLASCIKNAVNELRWLTQNRRPNTLDNLPPPDQYDFLGLFEIIDDFRNDNTTPAAIKTSLNKYHTLFSNAYYEKPGKRKHPISVVRSENKGQLQELDLGIFDEEVTITEIRSTLEKTKNVAQWQREENVSSPPDAARFIVAINEQTTRNNQLNAMLAHRFADQLKVRQQSAPCDYQGLTQFEVQQFVAYCIDQSTLSDGQVAEALIGSIAFGKTLKQLATLVENNDIDNRTKEHIRLTNDTLIYQVFHKLPSSTLSYDKDFMLHPVEHSFLLSCPRSGNAAVLLFVDEDSVYKLFVSDFNKLTGTRITLARLARYKKEWLAQQGHDETTVL